MGVPISGTAGGGWPALQHHRAAALVRGQWPRSVDSSLSAAGSGLVPARTR
jgi:hypothetical protein